MKFTLHYKKILLYALIGSSFNPYSILKAETDHHRTVDNRLEYENKFIHEAINNILTYIQGVKEGKDHFFDLSNTEPYQKHIDRFKKSLDFIKKITPIIEKEAQNNKYHSAGDTTTVQTVATIAKHLRHAQQKWVDAVDTYRNIVTLGIALLALEGMAKEIKEKITKELIPTLQEHLTDHALINEVEIIKNLISRIFSDVDENGNKYGPKYLMHRFKILSLRTTFLAHDSKDQK